MRSGPTPAWLEARNAGARLLGVVARRYVADDATSTHTTLGLATARDPTSEDAVAATQAMARPIHLDNNQLRVLWKVARLRHLGVMHDGLDLVTDAAIGALASGEMS